MNDNDKLSFSKILQNRCKFSYMRKLYLLLLIIIYYTEIILFPTS